MATSRARSGAAFAALLGATEGQIYTVAIGGVLAIVLLVTGIAPMRQRRDTAPIRPQAGLTTSDDSEFAAPAPTPPTTTVPALQPESPQLPPPSPPVATTTTTSAPQTVTATPPPSATTSAPLRVVFGRWSTGEVGAATGHPDVPADGLPIGARLGEDDTRSYVRLTGSEPALTLVETDDATANRSIDAAAIKACAITHPGWAIDNGVPHDQGPPWNAERCTDGVRENDGTWTFDLSGFDEEQRVGQSGFALVPAATDLTFQVVLSRTPPSSK